MAASRVDRGGTLREGLILATTISTMKRVVALVAALVLPLAACGGSGRALPARVAGSGGSVRFDLAGTGVLTGVIKRVGGPYIPHQPPEPGHVTVWKPPDSILPVVQQDLLHQGQHFRFILPAGRYLAIVGTSLDTPDCPAATVTVRPDTTTRVTLDTFCGVP